MTVTEYLAQCAGTRNWVCAAALYPALQREGYVRAIPYEELRHWLRNMPAHVTGVPHIGVSAPYQIGPAPRKRQRITVAESAEKLLTLIRRAGALVFDAVAAAYYCAGRVCDKRAVKRLIEAGRLQSCGDGLLPDMPQSWRVAA